MGFSRPSQVGQILVVAAKANRMPVFHPWGKSLRADLARFDFRRRLRRAGLGDAKRRELWIGELT